MRARAPRVSPARPAAHAGGLTLEGWGDLRLQLPLEDGWCLVESGRGVIQEHDAEARLAIGNGRFGLRAAQECSPPTSHPATLVAGLFATPDHEPRIPALVVAPDWLRLSLQLDGEPALPEASGAGAYRRVLDLRRGALLAEWRHSTSSGRVVQVRTLRLASLANRALAVQVVWICLEQPSSIRLEIGLESVPGMDVLASAPGSVLWRIPGGAAELAVATAAALGPPPQRPQAEPEHGQVWTWLGEPGQPQTFVHLLGIASGDASSNVAEQARGAVGRARHVGVRRVLARHTAAWQARWAASDVEVDGDTSAQQALRFAVYHLASAANPEDEHVSVGARGLTGEGYMGHVFWDTEIFLLPFYTLTWPEAARALLMYRYHTLPAARSKAARLGYRGALYAWESADTGDEVTPSWAVGQDGRVVRILCGTQEHHISADVAYAVWQYWQATRDARFLLDAGAEMLLETARFWSSRATLEADGRYHIRGVIGPDEFHEGVDDNAYTNGLAAWNLRRGLEVARLVARRWPSRWTALQARLELAEEELARWRQVADGLLTGFDPTTGLYEQFAGFFGLEHVQIPPYATRTAPVDVVLGPERIHQAQVVKQADVLMLAALLPDLFPGDSLAANVRYYEPRCAHGSSLSPAVHALVAARLGDLALAERYFCQATAIDLGDTRGDTAHGVHLGAQGGLWQAAIFGFAGLRLGPGSLKLDPHLPASWGGLAFRINWRGRVVRLELRRQPAHVSASLESGRPLRLDVAGESRRLRPGAPAIWVGAKVLA